MTTPAEPARDATDAAATSGAPDAHEAHEARDAHDPHRERAEAMFAADLTCQSLDIALEDVGPGRATLSMTLAATMVNGHGTAHGGFLFLLADAAFAYACNSHGPVAVAQTAQVAFLRPAGPGDELVAEAVERTRAGRTGIYDVTVRRPKDDAVIAEFRGQSVMLSGPARATGA